MERRGLKTLGTALLPVLFLGACAVIEQDFAEVEPQTIDVKGTPVEVRVLPVDEKHYDTHATLQGYEHHHNLLDERLTWKQLYSEDDPARHALYVEASKLALANYCRNSEPFIRSHSPVPWEPFVGRFKCL